MMSGYKKTISDAWNGIIESASKNKSLHPNLDGLKYWETIKIFLQDIDSRPRQEIKYNPEHKMVVEMFKPVLNKIPEKDSKGDLIEKNHFLLQQLNIPYKDQGKVSLRRFMQIALNIGQFEKFNNTDNFSPEVIQLIKEGKLSDIDTYMTPENYSKFSFTEVDLLNLKTILNEKFYLYLSLLLHLNCTIIFIIN